jgi:hypothetical protein
MKTNTTDLATAAQEFFAAYDAHDVEGMTARCADGARGRYTLYGRDSVVPIRGGIDVIWRLSYMLSEHLPNAMLLTDPDAGHGSLFQFHNSFVRQASLFLDSIS